MKDWFSGTVPVVRTDEEVHVGGILLWTPQQLDPPPLDKSALGLGISGDTIPLLDLADAIGLTIHMGRTAAVSGVVDMYGRRVRVFGRSDFVDGFTAGMCVTFGHHVGVYFFSAPMSTDPTARLRAWVFDTRHVLMEHALTGKLKSSLDRIGSDAQHLLYYLKEPRKWIKMPQAPPA